MTRHRKIRTMSVTELEEMDEATRFAFLNLLFLLIIGVLSKLYRKLDLNFLRWINLMFFLLRLNQVDYLARAVLARIVSTMLSLLKLLLEHFLWFWLQLKFNNSVYSILNYSTTYSYNKNCITKNKLIRLFHNLVR